MSTTSVRRTCLVAAFRLRETLAGICEESARGAHPSGLGCERGSSETKGAGTPSSRALLPRRGGASRRLTRAAVCLTLGLSSCRHAPANTSARSTSLESTPGDQARTDGTEKTSLPRLIVWLTVDQMSADSFERYAYLLGSGGFARLLESGLRYSAATYRHAITETAPGHASLFTGAAPAVHGIVGNSWLWPDGTARASVWDDSAPLVGPVLLEAEKQPTEGRSPRNLLVPTVGDALRRSTDGRAHVVALSAKDRGAILPGGFSGKAFWLGRAGFLTSRYYESAPPTWLTQHHTQFPPEGYLAQGWSLIRDESVYQSPESTHALRTRSFSAGFPHQVSSDSSAAAVLKLTPFGDAAVLDLARSAIDAYGLGQDETPDLLSLSLSSTDYVGHYFGPESREAEDNFARLDAQLASFFEHLDAKLGAEQVLFILSADHGISQSPEYLAELGLGGERITGEELLSHARLALEKAFGRSDLLLGLVPPSIYLDHRALAQHSLDAKDVSRVLADALEQLSAIARVYVTEDLLALEEGTPDDLAARVVTSLYPGRSGELYLVPAPYCQIDVEGDLVATHGSPYGYDRHVPLILSGTGIPHGTIQRPVDPRALAGTLAALLQLPTPAAARDSRLLEALPSRAD